MRKTISSLLISAAQLSALIALSAAPAKHMRLAVSALPPAVPVLSVARANTVRRMAVRLVCGSSRNTKSLGGQQSQVQQTSL